MFIVNVRIWPEREAKIPMPGATCLARMGDATSKLETTRPELLTKILVQPFSMNLSSGYADIFGKNSFRKTSLFHFR